MMNNYGQIPKKIREKLELAVSNNKNIINLAEEEYEYFKFNGGNTRKQLFYILPLFVITNIYSIYICYRDYGELKYIYKSLYLSLLLGIISLILFLFPILKRLHTILKLERNNTLLKNYLNREKLTKAELNKMNKIINAIEKYNKKLSKDYLDILERLPNNTIKKITTLRMMSDLNKSIKSFVNKAMSTLNSEQKLDDKLGIRIDRNGYSRIKDGSRVKGVKDKVVEGRKYGILQRIFGGMRSSRTGIGDKITEMRNSRTSKLGIIQKLSGKSKSLEDKIKAKEKESNERNDTIRRKLEEIDDFKYNPKQIDYIINKIENIPKREYNSKSEENFVKSNFKSRVEEQSRERIIPNRQPKFTGEGHSLALYDKQQNKDSQAQGQNEHNHSSIKNRKTDHRVNVSSDLFEAVKNASKLVLDTAEILLNKDLNGDKKIAGENIEHQSVQKEKNKQEVKFDMNSNSNKKKLFTNIDALEDFSSFSLSVNGISPIKQTNKRNISKNINSHSIV